jgi:hypothetical protein
MTDVDGRMLYEQRRRASSVRFLGGPDERMIDATYERAIASQ